MIERPDEAVHELRTAAGLPVHCVHNWRDETAPLVVLAPLFEGTVRHSALAMMELVANGFQTIRFDFTNHRGNSGGNLLDFTLSSGLRDLEVVMAEVDRIAPSAEGLALMGTSYGSRISLRYLSEGARGVDAFISMLGITDVAYTVRVVADVDVAHLLADPGHSFGVKKAIRYPLDFDNFMGDAVENGWHDLAGTQVEAGRVDTPTYLIVAEQDPWVRFADYQAVYGPDALDADGMFKLPGAGHEIFKNVEALKVAIAAATSCLHGFFMPDESPGPLEEPSMSDLITRNGVERSREARFRPGTPARA